MRVLVVCSYKKQYASHIAPFIEEQVASIQNQDVTVAYFLIKGKGILGYLKELGPMLSEIKQFQPDVIHAHFGLSGLLANLQRRVPVVTTYHGSDINIDSAFRFSKWCIRFSAWNIFVSKKNIQKAAPKEKFSIMPCGINLEDYPFMEKSQARNLLGWKQEERYVLFAGAFCNKVKNAPLAQTAVEQMNGVHLIEIKGYTRAEMATLYYASNVLLMTSHTEGSPQVIKEAMASGCPIVSVDVGDVAERIDGIEGCYIAERDPAAIAQKLRMAFDFNGRTEGRRKIDEMGLDNNEIAKNLIQIYQNVSNKR